MAATASGSDWAAEDQRRILHAVFRVGDLEKTVNLYKDAFGMEVLRERDVPEVSVGADMQCLVPAHEVC